MNIEKAIQILKENGYEVIEHSGWGMYDILENGESVNYGASAMEEEVIEFIEEYLL